MPANPEELLPQPTPSIEGDTEVRSLKYLEQDGCLDRGISVLKARGVRHATEVRRLNVEDRGVEVGAPLKGLRGVLAGLPTPLGG